jgi:radical SAM enzyme (TIGR01210 family)
MTRHLPTFTDAQVLHARGAKNVVDPRRPYAFLVEPEYQPNGRVESVATLFLTNRECPFRCLFCDLWQNTTDDRVPIGSIPAQIDFALDKLDPAQHIKLYNSGNFFDRQAIPAEDHSAIAERVHGFDTVIVENHPSLCDDACVRFHDQIATQLEIAIGLETAHPEILQRLNKRMTLADFSTASENLVAQGIRVRAFILVRAPFMTEAEGVEWAIRSMEFAFDRGVQCCSLIPTRGGNGAMEALAADNHFTPPTLESLEEVFDAGLAIGRGRVFVDLWDIAKLARCPRCGPSRTRRLQAMNLQQQRLPHVECDCLDE